MQLKLPVCNYIKTQKKDFFLSKSVLKWHIIYYIDAQ